jgi:RHS repeat-associated protein
VGSSIPDGSPNPTVTLRVQGRRLFVDYNAPNFYCKDAGDWPPGYTCIDLQVSPDQLQLWSGNNQLLLRAWIYYDYGTWDTGVDLACPGSNTFTAKIFYRKNSSDTPTVSTTQTFPLVEPCGTPDRASCPPGGGGAAASTTAGLPINVGSGDVTTTIPLFSIQQSPLSLDFNLTYHSSPLSYSSVSVPEPLGKGWTHPFNQVLKPIPGTSPQRLYHYTADGREHEYTQSGSVWSASRPGELRGTVTLVSGEYLLTDLDGTVTAFDQTSGRWKRTTDRWGNSISGTPVGSNPTTITDSAGRQLTLTYSSGVLQSISIPETPSARVWSFSYIGSTLLWHIRDPLHTSTDWRTLGYDAGNRLLAMTDDASKTLEGHTYDPVTGRGLTSYSEGGQRNFVQVEYDQPAPGQRRVTHRIDASTNQLSTFTLTYRGGRWLPTEINGPCSTCAGASGDTEAFTYTSDNHVETVTDGKGNVTTFGYNTDGNVSLMTQAFGTGIARTTTWGYTFTPWPNFWTTMSVPSTDGTHAKTTTRGWGTGETTLTITETGYSAGTQVSYITTQGYDAKHRLLSVNGPRTDVSDVTNYFHFADSPVSNNAGRLSSVTDAVSLQTTFADYDVFGTAKSTTDPNGAQALLTTDGRGRVLTRTLKAIGGDSEPADYVTTNAFDTRDRLGSIQFPRLNSTAYVYEDGTNRLTQTIRRDSSGNQQERLLHTLNDIGGRIEEDSQVCATPLPACTTWSTRRSEKFVYDTKNRLSQILHPVPLPADSTKIIYTYDADGLLWKVQDERHTSANTTYTYDALNRPWQVTQTLTGAPSNQIQTIYGYDAQDNLTSVTDPNGNITTYTFDDFHRMTRQVSLVSGTTNYSYDQAGNLSTTSDANGASTIRTYDATNRLLTATSTHTGFPPEVVTNTYDDLPATYGKGRLKTSSVTRGGIATVSTAYTYDRRGLVRSEAHTLLGYAYSASYGYDGNGNRTRVTYPSARIVNYTFDFADRPISANSTTPVARTFVSSATYEPFGLEKTLVFGNGTTRTAGWNARYQPSTLTLTGGSVGGAVSYTYSLDALGNITGITDNGNTAYNRTFGYDDLNRLATATTGTGGSPPLWGSPGTFTYYRAASPPTTTQPDVMNRTAMSLGSRSVTYAYDVSSNKFTSRLATVTEGAGTAVARDTAGNETGFGTVSSTYTTRNSLAGTGTTTYLYDGRGVRMAEQVPTGGALFFTLTPCRVFDTRDSSFPSGYGPPSLSPGVARTFTLRGRCSVPTTASSVSLNLTAINPQGAGYMALYPSDQGFGGTSTINFSAGQTRANNAVAKLSSAGALNVLLGSGASADAVLDVNGYFQSAVAQNRFFFYTPELNLLSETNLTWQTPAAQYEYIWFGNRPVAQEKVGDATALRYTMTDHLGTPFLQTNSAGAITWRAEYEPFGKVYAFRNGTAADWQPLRFPGQEERSTSPGRSYNVFRWYRPDLGQFTQADPVGLQGGINLFAYARLNPLLNTDPDGRRTFGVGGRFCIECKCKLPLPIKILAEDSPTFVATPQPGGCVDADAAYGPNGVVEVRDFGKCIVRCNEDGSAKDVACGVSIPPPIFFPCGAALPKGWPENDLCRK